MSDNNNPLQIYKQVELPTIEDDSDVSEILSNLKKIGDKYTDLLLTDRTLRAGVATKYFSIVRQSYSLLLEEKKARQAETTADVLQKFIKQIPSGRYKRPETYALYLGFCASYDSPAISRSEFYKKLYSNERFVLKRIRGLAYFDVN